MANRSWSMAHGRLGAAINHMPSAISRQPFAGRPSELEPDGELRLTRRRVDVGQQRVRGAEQRPPAYRIVAGADVAARDSEIRGIEEVEELRDHLGARGADAEELREAQVDIGEPWAIDRAHGRQVPRGSERIDGRQVQFSTSG